MPELVEEVIYPGALETKSKLAEELGEMKSQLSTQVARVRELRVKKVEQPGTEFSTLILRQRTSLRRHAVYLCFPDAFYGDDVVDLHNIDVMTDVSMAPTAFTRYTVAPSTASKKSRYFLVADLQQNGGPDLST